MESYYRSCIPFECAFVLCIRLDLVGKSERTSPILLLLHADITSTQQTLVSNPGLARNKGKISNA